MADLTRRSILAAGVVSAAAAATPEVLVQPDSRHGATGFYQRGEVRIRYLDTGSGFPLLLIPGRGLNSQIAVWPKMVFNALEEFRNDFRCITLDQRNAVGGESTGPIPVEDPWNAFADDQLGLMDHLGIRRFGFLGLCIGGPFGMKLMERAPERIAAAVLCHPVGHLPKDPDVMYNYSRDNWARDYLARHPEVSEDTIGKYFHNLYRARPDFVYSVSRDFARSCQTPILVMPDDSSAHPYQTSVDIASLAPNAQITVYPWEQPPELKARTIQRARAFLKAQLTA